MAKALKKPERFPGEELRKQLWGSNVLKNPNCFLAWMWIRHFSYMSTRVFKRGQIVLGLISLYLMYNQREVTRHKYGLIEFSNKNKRILIKMSIL